MIGVLIVAHDSLPDSLIKGLTHVLGTRPPQLEAFSVSADDDPFDLGNLLGGGGLDLGSLMEQASQMQQQMAEAGPWLRGWQSLLSSGPGYNCRKAKFLMQPTKELLRPNQELNQFFWHRSPG